MSSDSLPYMMHVQTSIHQYQIILLGDRGTQM